MNPPVKLDEDLSPFVGEPLTAAGYAVRTVVGQGWGGLQDEPLWLKVRSAEEFFITGDKGFGNIQKYPPGSHKGILVLRPDRDSIVEFRKLIEIVLARYEIVALVGALVVASPRSVRIRRPSA